MFWPKTLFFDCRSNLSISLKQELRVHMALVTRSEEPGAKSSYGMRFSKILRINSALRGKSDA